MADGLPPIPQLPPAHLVVRDLRASLNISVNANVTDITERAAKAMSEVAEATHVRPKRVVMRYTVLGTCVIGIFMCAVLAMTRAWALHPAVAVAALVAVAGPFGLVAAKVLPKVFEHSAGGGGG
jgi:hypothetical protein